MGFDFKCTKGTFHAKMGTIKDRNGMDLTEAEDIKKRWQKYILLGISFFESPSKYIDDSLIFFFPEMFVEF